MKLALAIACAALTARAQFSGPIVYFNHLKVDVALNPLITGRLTGWTIASPDWSRSIQFLVPEGGAHFYVRTNVAPVTCLRSNKFTLVQSSQPQTNIAATAYATGAWGNYTNSFGVAWSGAKTLSWTSHNIAGGPEVISGTLIMDVPDTFANGAASSGTVDETASFFYNDLRISGYTQMRDPLQ